MFIADEIEYVGVNDHRVDLFEGQYKVPHGMSYNSYVVKDEKIAVMDTVDAHFAGEWLENLQRVLGGRQPDYLVVQHMEPDHSANVAVFMETYPNAQIVASAKAFRHAVRRSPAGCGRGRYACARRAHAAFRRRAHGALAGSHRNVRR